jgi:hypothetical protein
LSDISNDKTNTVIFPFPADLQQFMKGIVKE